ncbi:transcriptional regulator/antitoxin MazE [Arcobacter sp. FW59]|nr:transcriptional regulator/antitoxin MazE [Arcobacter sp. FW59]
MLATLSKWGNSQGFRVSKEILEKLNLSVGDSVNIYQEKDRLVIEPIKKEKNYDIKELVKNLPKDYQVNEEIKSKMGSEIW